MAFSYQKLYTDIITSSGQVAILYLTWLKWLGVQQCVCGIEIYEADGTRHVSQTQQPPNHLQGLHEEGEISYTLLLPTPLHVRIQPTLAPWRPSGVSPLQGLSWYNRAPRAKVSVTWEDSKTPLQWEGEGYADWVDLSQRPSTLPLHKLQWGRLHLPSTTLVYTHMLARDGSPWIRVGEWTNERFHEHQDLSIDTLHPTGSLLHLPSSKHPSQSYQLSPLRTLHEGSAINKERYPNLLQRTLARWLSGPMQEARWLSQVSQPQALSSETGRALHEFVVFGKAREKV